MKVGHTKALKNFNIVNCFYLLSVLVQWLVPMFFKWPCIIPIFLNLAYLCYMSNVLLVVPVSLIIKWDSPSLKTTSMIFHIKVPKTWWESRCNKKDWESCIDISFTCLNVERLEAQIYYFRSINIMVNLNTCSTFLI